MVSTHKYDGQIALHNKSIAVLELKIKAMQALDRAQCNLIAYDKAERYAPIRLMNDLEKLVSRVDVYTRMIPRLNRYYASIASRVCESMAIVEVYDSKIQGIDVDRVAEETEYILG